MRAILVAVALAVSPIGARAVTTGPEFGLRAAYSLPFGDIVGDGAGNSLALGDLFSGGLPIQVDLGYRFTPSLYLGVFGSYGFLFATNCDPSGSCSGHDVRLGLDLQAHALPAGVIDPWFGIGVGYEWLSISASSGGLSEDSTLRGFEFAHAELGADFAVSSGFKLGPFASFSLGKYSDGSTSGFLGSASGSLGDTKVHEWLLFGLRARFLP